MRLGAGWIRLERLGVIVVSGPNRVKFLHNLLSNDIAGLTPGTSRLAALMNIKGQQVAWMRVLAEADALICEVPVAVRESVVETLVHYKVGAPVRFATPDVKVFAVLGEAAPSQLKALGLQTVPMQPDTFVAATLDGPSVRLSRGRDVPASGFTLHVDAAAATAFEERLRSHLGDAVSTATLDTLRVEEGIPWHGIDVKEENILHETGQLEAYHSASKGCYLGQEVVARLEGRGGHVNKRLRGLRCAQVAAPGAEILGDDTAVGRVTSAGLSPEFGAIAMGFVHRSHAEPGKRVRVAGAEAGIVALPFRA